MIHNPFTSSLFDQIWSKHFNKGKNSVRFDSIRGVNFVKHSYLPLYINVGKNLTKGIFYKLDAAQQDFKGKTFLVYDVPSYFNVQTIAPSKSSTLKVKKLYQYLGFLMDISSYNNQDDYINAQFSSKNRREFRSNQRRLETCFNIKYSFIHGAIKQNEFDKIFNQFHALLNKRFAEKHINYHHLSTSKWNYYKELVFEMLQVKKASLLIIYNENQPIGITLNFHADQVLFETITVFDPDYYKFSIGKTSIIKLLEWCFDNEYTISDFSKGNFNYKRKWGNKAYDFHYHIIYDSASMSSRIVANCVKWFFNAKLFLRKKNVNTWYRKLIFSLNRKEFRVSDLSLNFKIEKLDGFIVSEDFSEIDYRQKSYAFLLQPVYTFLFANPQPLVDIKVYYNKRNPNEYLITGASTTQKIKFTN